MNRDSACVGADIGLDTFIHLKFLHQSAQRFFFFVCFVFFFDSNWSYVLFKFDLCHRK